MKPVTLFLFLLIALQTFAQPKTIKGRIVDSNTQQGLAYTNIGIEGTFYGTASNAEGFFELKVPKEFLDETLYISAVGYGNVTYPISKLIDQEFTRIPLEEQTYSIEGVNVAAESLVLFRIVRTAAERVSQNYHYGPFSLKFHYLERTKYGAKESLDREAVVEMYDENGYMEPSIADAFKKRHYKFIQVNKNFAPYSFQGGESGFDELIEMDLARLSNTLFDEELLSDYDLYLEDVSTYEGDSVWIISYKANEADLPHTGDYYATKMEGKMYILKKSYALIRNECMIEASQNNSHNRSLYVKDRGQQEVRYHFTCAYKQHDGLYVVSYLDCDKTYISEKGEEVSNSRKAAVLELNKSPKMTKVAGRNYFENTAFVEKFWKGFHALQKEEL